MSHTYCFHQEMKICCLLIPDSLHQDRYIYFEIKVITFETTPTCGPKVPILNTSSHLEFIFFTSHHPVWSGTLSRNSNILDGKMHYVPDWQQRCFDDVNHCYVQLFMHRNDGLFTRLQEGQSKDLTLFEARWGADSDPLSFICGSPKNNGKYFVYSSYIWVCWRFNHVLRQCITARSRGGGSDA